MSLWKFRNFEAEVDLMDADFYDALEEAQNQLNADYRSVPNTGKKSDIIRAQVRCFSNFFDTLFGHGASDVISEEKMSLKPFMDAADALEEFIKSDVKGMDSQYRNYIPKTGNRQQRRYYNKQNTKNGKNQNWRQ